MSQSDFITIDKSDEFVLKSCFDVGEGGHIDSMSFEKSSQLYPIISNKNKREWVRFKLSPKEDIQAHIFLRSPHASEVSLYQNNGYHKTVQLNGLKRVNGGYIQPISLWKGKPTTIVISSKGYLPYLSFPISLIPANKTTKVLEQQTLNWGFFMGLIVMLSCVMLGLSIIIRMTPYSITAFWSLCMLSLFAWQKGLIFTIVPFELSEISKSATFFFLRGMTILTFLFLIRRVTVLESKFNPIYKSFFTTLLVITAVFQLVFLLLGFIAPSFIQKYQNISLVLFWVLVISSFGFCFMWLIRAIQRNRNFGYFFLTFFLPFGAFGLSNANNYYGITNTIIEVPKVYCIGLLIQLIILLAILVSELINEVKQEVEIENEREIRTKEKPSSIEFDLSKILTKRELEVFNAYCNGFTYQEISDAFFVSPNTVRTHLKNIYKKLDINSKAEAIMLSNP